MKRRRFKIIGIIVTTVILIVVIVALALYTSKKQAEQAETTPVNSENLSGIYVGSELDMNDIINITKKDGRYKFEIITFGTGIRGEGSFKKKKFDKYKEIEFNVKYDEYLDDEMFYLSVDEQGQLIISSDFDWDMVSYEFHYDEETSMDYNYLKVNNPEFDFDDVLDVNEKLEYVLNSNPVYYRGYSVEGSKFTFTVDYKYPVDKSGRQQSFENEDTDKIETCPVLVVCTKHGNGEYEVELY